MVRFARHQRLYEQSRGGWRREVRLKVTLPAEESNLADRGARLTSLPCW